MPVEVMLTVSVEASRGRKTAPVSVILPVFNGSRDLGRALQSIAAQTLPPAEIIVVDDGSTDDSAEIARNAGCIVVRKQNGGAASAVNAGIAIAKEPWFAFLCHDDAWHPRKLELQIELLDAYPALDLLCTDVDVFASDGTVLQRSAVSAIWNYPMMLKTQIGPHAYVCDPQTLAATFPFGGVLFLATSLIRGSFLRAVGGLDERIPFGGSDDTEFLLRCIKSARAATIELALYSIYRHPGQISADPWRNERVNVPLFERIIADPGKYHPASITGLRTVIRRSCFRLAWHEGRAGRFQSASSYLAKAFCDDSPSHIVAGFIRALFGLLLESFPLPVQRRVWALRRKLVRRPRAGCGSNVNEG